MHQLTIKLLAKFVFLFYLDLDNTSKYTRKQDKRDGDYDNEDDEEVGLKGLKKKDASKNLGLELKK